MNTATALEIPSTAGFTPTSVGDTVIFSNIDETIIKIRPTGLVDLVTYTGGLPTAHDRVGHGPGPGCWSWPGEAFRRHASGKVKV